MQIIERDNVKEDNMFMFKAKFKLVGFSLSTIVPK